MGGHWQEDAAKRTADELIDRARSALREVVPGADGSRELIDLPEGFESTLTSGLRADDTGTFVALPRPVADHLIDELKALLDHRDPRSLAALVRSPELRRSVRRLVEPIWPQLAVLVEGDFSNPPARVDDRVMGVGRQQ